MNLENKKCKVNIIKDAEGKSLVIINDIRFKGHRKYKRHAERAKKGWYRYDTRFALPVYNEAGEMVRYNIFTMRLLVRHSENGKLYLYDILRTKKEK